MASGNNKNKPKPAKAPKKVEIIDNKLICLFFVRH